MDDKICMPGGLKAQIAILADYDSYAISSAMLS